MTPSTASPSATWSAALSLVVSCLTSLLLAVLFWVLIQRSHYLPLLAFAFPVPSAEEQVALPWTVCAQTVLFLVPGTLAAALASWRGRPQLAQRLFLVWTSLVLVGLAIDLQMYAALGRHLAELLRFAFVPGAFQAAGDRGHWGWLCAAWLAVAAATTAALTYCVRRSITWLIARWSRGFTLLLGSLFVFLLGVGVAAPFFFGALYRHAALREGLAAELAWSPRFGAGIGRPSFQDPHWAALETGLARSYARVFPLVFAEHHVAVESSTPGQRRNVLLIVAESFRADAFTKERMPRLFAWAERGLIAEQHYGGSTYSEAGAFSLLFGRSPLLFDFTLDTQQKPTWCAVAHSLNMDCSYYSGHPKIWMRREEFLNPSAVDHFVHDDTGNWNQWDRTALEHAVAAIQNAGNRPAISLVLLMSTHFEYQYPPAYERHVPVLVGAKWQETNAVGLTAASRVPLTNRYLNSVAFTDDLVADAIEKLNPTNTVVVFTGDHGESLGDDDRFGHGYGFPDVIAKVPFAMVGPGVPATKRDTPSLHADVLRTLIHLEGGKPTGPGDSEDLLTARPTRASLLLAHCAYSHDFADALFIHGSRRIRLELGLRTPEVRLRGAEDALGRPLSLNDLNPAQTEELVSAFERELETLWQPGSPG